MSNKFIFFNFTDKPFTGFWNGKAYTFKSGVKKYYPQLIARHFAKHLTNQILNETGNERSTSPKKPEEVPVFMEIFNKAFLVEEIPDDDNLDIESGGKKVGEASMNIKTKPREMIDPYDASANPAVGPGGTPQIIGVDVEPEGEPKQDPKTDEDDYEDSPKTINNESDESEAK